MVKGRQVNLIDKKFGKLLVISKATSILGGQNPPRYWGAWNCKCDCGNLKISKTTDLNKGTVRSCGCLYNEFGRSLLPGQNFTRLTTISYENGKWLCKCICSNLINIKTDALTSGNTKSCGCLKTELLSERSEKLINSSRQFKPLIASARRIWKSYCYRDIDCVEFDDFYKISQQNCYYCGIIPSTEYNYFLTKSVKGSDKAKLEGLFIYNGLDRVDNTKSHTINNVVACCPICNRAKSDRTIKEFLSWIKTLQILEFKPLNIKLITMPIKSLLTSIKCVFYNYKKDTDMVVEEYYSISQMNCFYCNSIPNNIFNRAKIDKKSSEKAKMTGDYIYNGIDRIDSCLKHTKNNIVPCCYNCNRTKSDLTLKEFQNWIIRIKSYQENKKET